MGVQVHLHIFLGSAEDESESEFRALNALLPGKETPITVEYEPARS